jgi:hypothetical protein
MVGGNALFRFVREQMSIDGTSTVEIEVSSDLRDWSTRYSVPAGAVVNQPGVTVQRNFPVAGKDTVTLALPLTGETGFVRMKVTP